MTQEDLLFDLTQQVESLRERVEALEAAAAPRVPSPGEILEAEHVRLRDRGRDHLQRIRRGRGEG